MKIRIGFSTTNSLFSRAIRYITESKVSHTYIRIYDEFLQVPLIIHSDWPGVVFDHGEQFDLDNIIVQEYEIKSPFLKPAIKHNLWHLRKKYHWLRVINLAFLVIFKRWLVRKVKNPSINPRSLICVDFILYLLNDAGLTSLPIGTMTPHELMEWFENNYEKLGWLKVVAHA